jgi:uncharacterized protein
MIIDFRVRPPAKTFTSLNIFPKPEEERTKSFGWHSPLPPSVRKRSMPLFLEEMKSVGISYGVLWGRGVSHRPDESTTAADVADMIKEYPDVFRAGFAGVGVPEPGGITEWIGVVDEAIGKLGLAGITVDAQFSYPQARSDDPRLYPIYQRCSELGGILALTVSRGTEPYENVSMASPEAVDNLAGDFPNMKIVVSHAFWPWVLQGIGVAFRRPNVFLCPDPYGLGMPGYLEFVQAANTFLEDRLIFASTYPRMGMQEAVAGYLKLPFKNETVLEKVMYKNAATLLGIS